MFRYKSATAAAEILLFLSCISTYTVYNTHRLFFNRCRKIIKEKFVLNAFMQTLSNCVRISVLHRSETTKTAPYNFADINFENENGN